MKKSLKILFALCLLFGISACGKPSNVRSEMMLMSRYTNELLDANTAADFHNAAEKLREITQQAMEIRPSTVDNDEQFKGYQQEMQHFIDAVEQADQLAQQGQLEQAKELSQKLLELKKQGHIEYKNK